ncbi:MAG: GTP 3',8-cyclase MoaA [Bacteroidia bacterium]|nr:GTP 3',8-cyclase MoaA [Bacteroidia bacterium]
MSLFDTFGRVHNYLRISLIDTCNFSCTYCVPHQKPGKKKAEELMNAQEIYEIAGVFVGLGIDKIRLTGGEPTLRKDFGQIIRKLSEYPVQLTLTTNGFLLYEFLEDLEVAGVKSINISIDSLREERFKAISKANGFKTVYNNIFLLLEKGFHIKLNVVLMRGVNDDEANDFIELTRNYPLHIRFIEFMPFTDNEWERNKVISYQELIEQLSDKYELIKLPDQLHDTTKKYKVAGYKGTLAVISSVSNPFCSGCNRLRISADGKMRNCLFAQTNMDLLTPFRNGENIVSLIEQNVKAKAFQYGGQQMTPDIKNSQMLLIGG